MATSIHAALSSLVDMISLLLMEINFVITLLQCVINAIVSCFVKMHKSIPALQVESCLGKISEGKGCYPKSVAVPDA